MKRHERFRIAMNRRGRCELRRAAAWTLVELLVVIGIVAVLAAFLFPALSGARQTAQLATSVQNVRKLQLGNHQFSVDHNGWYVEALSAGVPWMRNPEFRRYFGLNNPNDLYYWPAGLLSPRATLNRKGNQGLMNQSYGYNVTGLVDYRIKNTSVARPSETLAFADALDWWILRSSADYYSGVEVPLVQGIAYRYYGKNYDKTNGRAAVCYFDGHAEALRRDQVVGNLKLWTILQ